MKKITAVLTAFVFMFVNANLSYANYDGYKAYVKGILALKDGNADLAVSEYEKVIAYDKSAVPVYKDMANIYWQMGKTQKALETAKILEGIDGENVKTNIFLGTFYLSVNQMESAKKTWEKVLELDPANEMATVYLAAYYYSDNKLDESADYWNKFLKQQPESSEGYFQLGLVQEKRGMLEQALESYKKVNELKPEAREAYLARARIYENQKQYNLAVHEYEEYIKIFPDNISILLYLGKCYFEEKRYFEAEKIILRAKKIEPDNITLHYLLGMVYEKQGKINEAIENFEYISKNEPGSFVFARLGYYYALKQNYKTAELNLNKAINLEPFNAEFCYLAGLNHIDAQNYKKAEIFLQKALSLKPDFIDAKFYLAVVYDKLNQFEKTELLLQEIIKQQPENAKVLNYLGYSYAERNIKLDDAEKLLIKVTELYPNDPAFLDSLAWLYYRTGKYTQAEKYIFMAINTHPQLFDYTLYEHLGDISIELNKLPQAWLAYAVSCDIGSKPAKTKMKLIEKKVSPDEINKVTAERAVHNFIRIAALNAGYKLKIKSNNVKVNSYLSVLYGNQFGIKAGVAPKLAMPEINVYFSKGNIKFEPQAARDSLPEDVLAMFDFASFLFSKDFVKMLYSSAIKQKGNTLSYENEKYIIKINRKDGMFKEFILKDLLSLKISSYKQFNKISKVPAKMIFSSRKTNFICDMKLNKISFPDEEDFIPFKDMRNDSKSAGKN